MAEDSEFRVLEWDSDKFGFPVARVRGSAPASALPDIVARMRARGVRLAYYSTTDTTEPLADRVKVLVGASLVDTRVTYINKAAAREPTPDGIGRSNSSGEIVVHSYSGPADRDLIALARQAGEFSRFCVDPRIDVRVFHAIYDAWLIRSVQREIADDVFVGALGSRPVGLLTLALTEGRGTIGLLSVASAARGQGLGRRLVKLATAWSQSRGCATQVATQLANTPACRLYEAAGFKVEARERTYHLWL